MFNFSLPESNMKCAFLLGSAQISGGTYVIFEHAIRMQKLGVDITIITEEKVRSEDIVWHKEAKELVFLTYDQVKECHFDIVFATWWRTVYELHRINATKYAYFVQSIETRFYSEKQIALRRLVEATYLLNLPTITEASWIEHYLGQYGNQPYLVKNGIRKDIYSAEGEVVAPKEAGKLRVLIEGPLGVFFKNTENAIKLALASNADEVWLLTSSDIKAYPGVARVFSRIPMFETPSIYRSCDVLVKLSYVEGMFGPPLEIFSCGGTAIVYNVTGHDEYIVNAHNALVLDCDNETGVVKAINKLKARPELLAELKANAAKTASGWPSWQNQAENFKSAVEEILVKETILPSSIKVRAKFFFDWYVEEEKSGVLVKEKMLQWVRRRSWLVKILRIIHVGLKRSRGY